eukprot:292031-Alexandrium_andersonii.AAC.1
MVETRLDDLRSPVASLGQHGTHIGPPGHYDVVAQSAFDESLLPAVVGAPDAERGSSPCTVQ